jgi:hypothetical protein
VAGDAARTSRPLIRCAVAVAVGRACQGLCLLAAVGALSVSVAGRSFRTIAFAAVAVPIAALRGVPWVVRGPRGTGGTVGRGGLRVAAAAVVGLGMVAMFAALLADAAAAFARIVARAGVAGSGAVRGRAQRGALRLDGEHRHGYLWTLSADAAPALAALPEPLRSCALHQVTPSPDADWRSANSSRTAARELPRTPPLCP